MYIAHRPTRCSRGIKHHPALIVWIVFQLYSFTILIAFKLLINCTRNGLFSQPFFENFVRFALEFVGGKKHQSFAVV